MIHFPANPSCVTRSKDNDARISRVADLEEFRDWRRTFPEAYCPECANEAKVRTDSERYAELRALVEKWQAAHREHDQAKTTAPETDGWLKRWLNFCDAQKPLLDWSHR